MGALRTEIYAVTVDGSNLRRLTSVPRPIAYPNYPQGVVELSVVHPAVSGGRSVAYLQGSQQAYGWLAATAERRTIRYTLADLGEGVLQPAMLHNEGYCYYDQAAVVDVVAGQETVVAQQLPPTTLAFDYQCPLRYSAQWLDNDQIVFLLRDTLDRTAALNFSPAFSMRLTPVEGLSPTAPAEEIARYTSLDRVGDTYFNVVEGSHAEFLYLRTRSGGSGEFLVLGRVNSPLGSEEDRAFRGSLSQPDSANLTQLTLCPGELGCDVADAAWLPNDDAFVYTSSEDVSHSSLRVQSGRGAAAADRVVVEVTDGQLGAVAVSPDGESVVVERRATSSTSTDLWILDLESGSFDLFVPDGASPAWR